MRSSTFLWLFALSILPFTVYANDNHVLPISFDEVVCNMCGTHLGVDLMNDNIGTPFYSIADNGEIYLYRDDAGSYGGAGVPGEVLFVRYQKPDGHYFIVQYGHVMNVPEKFRQNNAAIVSDVGTFLGEMADYDPCMGGGGSCPHIHFGIWDSDDPLPPTNPAEGDGWGYSPYQRSWVDPLMFISKNDIEVEFAANGGEDNFGVPVGDVHIWDPNPDPYWPEYIDGFPQQCYIQDYSGGAFGSAVIVFDAWAGARRAFTVHSEFWTVWQQQGGPTGELGMPITDKYSQGANVSRQDFQKGYLYDDGSVVTSHPSDYMPGRTSAGWNHQYSYLIGLAYERNGARNAVGEAQGLVEVHPDNMPYTHYMRQIFDGGDYGECEIMYDQENPLGNPFATNEAYLLRTGFRNAYYNLPDENVVGPRDYGCPTRDEYDTDPGNQQWPKPVQFFLKRNTDGTTEQHYMYDDESGFHYNSEYGMETVSLNPAGLYVCPLNQLVEFEVKCKNTGITAWSNNPDADNYVELKACDGDGNVLHDGSSPLRFEQDDWGWLNQESPCSMEEAIVYPEIEDPNNCTATFRFIGRIDPNGAGIIPAYFRLNHATGLLMPGWEGMYFQLDTRTSWWFANTPRNDCYGPLDPWSHDWSQPDFVLTTSPWVPVTVPNSGWGCNDCDRFYRLWYQYEGTQSGNGVTIHFASDDAIEVYVNGTPIGEWGAGCHVGGCVNNGGVNCGINYSAPDMDITSYLFEGQNLVAAHVSDRDGGEAFSMQFYPAPLNITDDAICCRGEDLCQEITPSYPSQSCIADGGTVYVGDWFDCGTFSSCDNPQTKSGSDPTLFFQGPAPMPSPPAEATFNLIDTLPRTAWYALPESIGEDTLYVSDFTGYFSVSTASSGNPDTFDVIITDYAFECPSVLLMGIPTGTNHVRLDTTVVQDGGTYVQSTHMVDVTINTVLFNDLFPEDTPIKGRSQVRGRLNHTSGVLSVGSVGYNVLPGPVLTPGDVDGDDLCNVGDAVYIVNYIFKGGPPPVPVLEAGDVDCDGLVNVADAVYLIVYVFKGGPSPCEHF